nr:unnamed protein product [Digitaria exilis]
MDALADLASYPNDVSFSDCLGWEGFPSILWSVLQALDYPTPPQYERTIIRDRGVVRSRVRLVVYRHPPCPSSPTWTVEVHGHHMETTCELAALNGISSFVAQNQELVEHQLLGLFPPTQPDDPHWMRRYLSSPLRMAENPVAAAALMMRWMRAYHRLQALLRRSQSEMLNIAMDMSARARDIGVERTSLSIEVTTRVAMIADLERQLNDLHIAHNNTQNELAQTRDELEEVHGTLEHANAMLAAHDAQHLLDQQGGDVDGEGEAPDSDMDTEDDMPPLPAPPSPMGSEATANNLDDF